MTEQKIDFTPGVLKGPPRNNKCCQLCRWWDELDPRYVKEIGKLQTMHWGFCRLAPPMIANGGGFPATVSFDRCSHFKWDEEDDWSDIQGQ